MEKHRFILYYTRMILGKEKPFVLAHLSDPHVSSPLGVRLSSLLTNVCSAISPGAVVAAASTPCHIIEALMRDLAEAAPDHGGRNG